MTETERAEALVIAHAELAVLREQGRVLAEDVREQLGSR